jgi:hypothetical protein
VPLNFMKNETKRKRAAKLEILNSWKCFESKIEESIAFHKSNQNDQYNVGDAVITALIEVKSAIRAAINNTHFTE